MSRRHAWLAFTAGGPALTRTLDTDPVTWQRQLTVLQGRWYDLDAPPQVAAVFVLQWLLQVPAHTAAHAASAGPWRADLGAASPSTSDPHWSRQACGSPHCSRMPAPLAERMERAERDYRAVADPVAAAYPAQVRIGPHTRAALVDDMWSAARREAETRGQGCSGRGCHRASRAA